MAGIDSSYQVKVGFEQGAEKIFVKADGYMKFFDEDLSGSQLKALLVAPTNKTTIVNTAGVLSVTNIPSVHGVVIFSIADAASNASAYLPSCTVGQQLVLMGRGAGSVASVLISTLTGVTLIGRLSGDASSISFYFNSATQPLVRLHATAEDEWSVMEQEGQVSVQASA